MGIRRWSVDTRHEVARYDPAKITSVAFSPDGAEVFGTEDRADGPVTLIRRAPGFEETDAPGGR